VLSYSNMERDVTVCGAASSYVRPLRSLNLRRSQGNSRLLEMGVVRWQMDAVEPEDLNGGKKLVSEQREAHPSSLDKTLSCCKERCGGNYRDSYRNGVKSQAAILPKMLSSHSLLIPPHVLESLVLLTFVQIMTEY
jgi:hypothetical protein